MPSFAQEPDARAAGLARDNPEAWMVFVEFARAVRLRRPSDQRLIQKLASVAADHFGEDQRRVRLLNAVERAHEDMTAQAIDAVAAIIHVEMVRAGSLDQFEFAEWPLDEIRAELQAVKVDQRKPADRRGGRDRRGSPRAAAELSRKFGLFGDSKSTATNSVAAKFRTARARTAEK